MISAVTEPRPRPNFFRLIIAIIGLGVLGALAFLPLSALDYPPMYERLLMDSLHFPAVFCLGLLLSPFLRSTRVLILLVVAMIVGVELAQTFLDRESSWGDIGSGLVGLGAFLMWHSRRFKLQLVAVAVSIASIAYFATPFMLYHEFYNDFPTLGNFAKASHRLAWEPMPIEFEDEQIETSLMLFRNSKRFSAIRANKSKPEYPYWGVRARLHTRGVDEQPTHINFWARADNSFNIEVRLDDRDYPQLEERINLEITLEPEWQFFQLPLHPVPTSYNWQDISKVAMFARTEADGRWFEVADLHLSSLNGAIVK